MLIQHTDRPLAAQDPNGATAACNRIIDVLVHFGYDRVQSTGLDFYFYGGAARFDNTVYVIAAGSLTLADDDTSYVEIDDTGTVTANVTSFTSGAIPVAEVTTASGAITLYTDARAWLQNGAGSVGISDYYAEDAANHSGLDYAYLAGAVRDDNAVSDTAAGTVTLADDDTSYVEVDPATGVVSDNVTGFTAGSIPLAEVVTASGAITAVTDRRTWAGNGPAGGGSGAAPLYAVTEDGHIVVASGVPVTLEV